MYLRLLLFRVAAAGYGFVLCYLGFAFFFLIFHCKLHSIPESRSKGYKHQFLTGIFSIFIILSCKFIIAKIFLTKYDVTMIVSLMHHIFFLANLIVQILILKYFIHQNPNLRLYVNVYHHQPPPILPWQLPDDFNPGSINIIVVKSNYE